MAPMLPPTFRAALLHSLRPVCGSRATSALLVVAATSTPPATMGEVAPRPTLHARCNVVMPRGDVTTRYPPMAQLLATKTQVGPDESVQTAGWVSTGQ